MGKISDQLREWTRRARADEHMSLRELDAIADRIDAEMVELPRDIDGVPINLGDTVYLEGGRKAEVRRIILGQEKTSIDLWMCDKGSFFFSVAQRNITHTVPDSWEHIARDLEDWAEGNISGSAQSFAGRIRKLAAKED